MKFVWQISRPPSEWCEFGQVFKGKTGACQMAQNGPMLKFFWPKLFRNRVTESQTPKGTQYIGGWKFFVPDFNKLPYSLCSQGDNNRRIKSLTLDDLLTYLGTTLRRSYDPNSRPSPPKWSAEMGKLKVLHVNPTYHCMYTVSFSKQQWSKQKLHKKWN